MASIDTVVESIGGSVAFGASAFPHVRGWSLSIKAEANKYSSTDTAGWTGKMMGPKDWSGSFTAYIDDTTKVESIAPIGGLASTFETIHLKCGLAGAQDYTGTAVLTGCDIEMDHETGKPVAATLTFEGHGALTPAFAGV